MANLFWKTPHGVKAILATPFKTEEEFERMVFGTSELLEDIFLLKRQIRGGNKSGIPDIVGIDSDGNVCIVEMKNCPVDSSIIPQVLQYAFWAETNPDSIKSLWLECDNRPDDITISWEKLQVRILIIAPSILRSTLDLIDKINYPVDLIEVKRWTEAENEILLVNKLEPELKKYPKPVSGQPVYDEAFYKTIYNDASVEQYLKYAGDLEQFVKKQGWDLEIKFNKNYCGFKAGFFNAFGIKWIGSKTFAFFFKLPERDAESVGISMTKYDNQWKEAVYYIEPGKTKIPDLKPLFELAYKKLTGN
jgi:hypothetical protein